jgi:hypothetical protein
MNALNRTSEIMSRLFALTTVAAVTVLVLLAGCSTQAPAPCQIQPSGNGPYTVKFTNTGTATGSCPAVLVDQWFMDNYAGAAGSNVLTIGMISVNGPGAPFPPDPTSSVYGRGTFTSHDPDSNDLCTLPTVNTFDGPGGSTYAVTNLAFLSTALYIGSQWKGDVTYAPVKGGPTCDYSAQAINPSTTCASNADCNPTSQPVNSGINYLYDQGCNLTDFASLTGDPATGICFFNKPFPSLGGFTP